MSKADNNNLELANDAHKKFWEMQLRISQSTVDAGTITLRTLVLVNGGAVIAMLAFLANIADLDQPDIFDGVIEALALFAFGVFAALLTAGFTYSGNYAGTMMTSAMDKIWEPPFVVHTPASNRWSFISWTLLLFTVLCGITSAGLFLAGIISLKSSMLSVL